MQHETPFASPSALQEAYFQWWTDRPVDGIAATLTFKPTFRGWRLNEQIAAETVRHFVLRLNRRVLGRNKTSEPLEILAVREGSSRLGCKHIHYHFLIQVPSALDHDAMMSTAESIWTSLDWASKEQNRLSPHADKHWVSYILKLRDKPDYAMAIDIRNSYRRPDGMPTAPS